MQIDVTYFIGEDMWEFAHSAHEGGENAGGNTWKAAVEQVRKKPLLEGGEAVEEGRDFIRSSGGWTNEEVDAMSAERINALILQFLASDVRKCPLRLDDVSFKQQAGNWLYVYEPPGGALHMSGFFDSRSSAYKAAAKRLGVENARAECLEDIDWEETQEMSEVGAIGSRLYKTEDGKIYFDLSN